MGKRMPRFLLVGGLIAAAIFAGLYYASRVRSTTRSEETTSEITLRVTRGDIVDEISETGAVEADANVNVAALTGGTVAEVYVSEGAVVSSGQRLLRLMNEDLDIKVAQARLSLESAENSLRSALDNASAIRSAELKVRQAELNHADVLKDVAKLTVTSPIDGRVTDLNVTEGATLELNGNIATVINDRALYLRDTIKETDLPRVPAGTPVKVNVGVNQITHEGTVVSIGSVGRSIGHSTYTYFDVVIRLGKKLADHIEFTPLAGMNGYFYCNEFGPGERVKSEGGSLDIEDSRSLKASLNAEVASVLVQDGDIVQTGDTLVVLRSDSLLLKLDQAENELAIARDNLDKLRNPDVAAQCIKVEQEKLNLANLLQQAADLTVVAPASGTVTEKPVQPGDRLSAGNTVLTLVDAGTRSVRISVDELEITKVKVGQPVTIKVDALPGKTYTGEVSYVSNSGTVRSGVATFDVLIRISNPEQLWPGMTAQVTIVAARKENVLRLPAEAVIFQDGRGFVRVSGPEGIKFVGIETGLATTAAVEVISGLSVDDLVLLPSSGSSTATNFFGGGLMGGVRAGGVRPTPQAPAASGTRRN